MPRPGQQGKSVGNARVIVEADISPGGGALEIINFHANELGFLDSTFRIMPLIPNEWRGGGLQPAAFATVYAMAFVRLGGEAPELLILTATGVFRYAPWRRAVGGTNPGLAEQFLWTGPGGSESIVPQSTPRFPPQIEVAGSRVYFTFCDGGGAWVWDGDRIRAFGYTARPTPPDVEGPQRDGTGKANAGAWSVQGRVGDVNTDWLTPTAEVVGGIDKFRRQYACVYENTDGAYSGTSALGGIASIRFGLADPSGTPAVYAEELRRRFRLYNIPADWPPGTANLILLCTRNLERTTDAGDLRFLHRLPGPADEYIDDIPDGELGAVWVNRMATPIGFYFLRFFGGSLFMMRTDGHPSRVWWSEQEGLNGPIPESIIEGHFRDVFPSTGAITGSIVTRLHMDSTQPAMLIGTERAMHFVAGAYPHWQFGTLHAHAALAGPSLIQNCPDGTVMWYGGRTFWQLFTDGRVEDVGALVRRRLNRVNHADAHMGVSWVDTRRGEVTFYLPSDDQTRPSWGFVYDYRAQGFRFINGIPAVDAVVTIPDNGLVIVAGTFDAVRTVYVYGRGYPGYAVTSPTWQYGTGWSSFQEFGPNLHAPHNANEGVFTLAERSSGTATLTTRADWNDDEPVEVDPLHLAHPENDDIPYYAPATTGTAAKYGSAVWRKRRMYTERHGLGITSHITFRIHIRGVQPVALMNIDVYGPRVALPAARAPEGGPHSED